MAPKKKRPASREWEQHEYDWERPVSWDVAGPTDACGSDVEDLDANPETWSTEQVAQVAADFIIGLKTEGILSATQACVLCYWASLSKGEGLIRELALKPGNPTTGRYSEHWDKVLGSRPSEETVFLIDTPLQQRADAVTCPYPMPTLPPHHLLHEQWCEKEAEMRNALTRWMADETLGPIYADHPTVRSAEDDEFVTPYVVC